MKDHRKRPGKKFLLLCLVLLLLSGVSACGAAGAPAAATLPPEETLAPSGAENTEETAVMKMKLQIGGAAFTATLEDNAAAAELMEMLRVEPLSIAMSDYGGFEKVGSLGKSLTTDNHQTTTAAGDIVLYSGNQIVLFYGSNSWSYTRLGRVEDLTGWEEALGSGSITAELSLADSTK